MTNTIYIRDNEYESRPNVLLFASRTALAEPPATASNTRALETVIRERLSRLGQKAVAHESGIEKTKINRLVSGTTGLGLSDLYPFLAALGLGVIECDDPEMVSLPRTELEALQTLARKALAQITEG